MKVWSNQSPTREDYVEIQLCDRTAIRFQGRNEVGWSVSSQVFSRSPRYDSLVEVSRCFRSFQGEAALALVRSLAAQHGLVEDVGLAHRRRLWSV